MVGHLVGMQAQAPQSPYVGLWSRLERFDPASLSQLLVDRRVVRMAVMRGTVHLVTAGDCLWLRPLVQSIYDRDLVTNTTFGPALLGLDLAPVEAFGRALLESLPHTPKKLGIALAAAWPDRDPAALAHAMRGRLPLVQIPPRGLWGASGATTYTTAESWLGRPLDPAPSVDDLVLRYLAAFGPATVADVQAWSGLTRLGEVVERLRPSRVAFVDDLGRTLLDLPSAPRPDPEVAAPVRFLPEFDNLLVSHADRSRVISDDDRRRLMTVNGIVPGSFLVDGYFHGIWKIRRSRGTAVLTVEAFRPLTSRVKAAVNAEGARLLRFVAAGDDHDIQVRSADS